MVLTCQRSRPQSEGSDCQKNTDADAHSTSTCSNPQKQFQWDTQKQNHCCSYRETFLTVFNRSFPVVIINIGQQEETKFSFICSFPSQTTFISLSTSRCHSNRCSWAPPAVREGAPLKGTQVTPGGTNRADGVRGHRLELSDSKRHGNSKLGQRLRNRRQHTKNK